MRHEKWQLGRKLNGAQKFWVAVGAFLVLGLVAALYSNYVISRQLQAYKTATETAHQAEIEALLGENVMLMSKLARTNDEMYALREELVIWQDLLLENDIRLDRMGDFYRNHDPYKESLVETDAEFLVYCKQHYPEAVYNSNEWTAEGILQTYVEQPEIWGFWPDDYSGNGFYFAWTPDEQHCLIIDPELPRPTGAHEELYSGWVVVDGVRVHFYGETREAVDPQSLTAAYRSGEWNGGLVRSADWGTTVFVDENDCLNYLYMAFYYDATYDPAGLAYTGYEEPWWAGEVDSDVATLTGEMMYHPADELGGILAFGEALVRLGEG